MDAPPTFDEIVHQPTRLRVMAVLYRNRELAVHTLRKELGLSDGNLASHLGRLEAAGYARIQRRLVGVRFEVHACLTEAGAAAFRDYIAQLRRFLESAPEGPSIRATGPPTS